MDPKACLDRAEEALFVGDLEEVRAALSDYRAWRFAGGFEPRFGDRKAAVIQENLDAREEEALGEWRYVAHPTEIERVRVIEIGDGGRILRNPPENPIMVETSDGDRYVVGAAWVFSDPIAASIASAELARKNED